MNIDMTIVPEIRIGPVVFYDVPMAFADAPPFKLFGVANEPAFLMGTDMLSTSNVPTYLRGESSACI